MFEKMNSGSNYGSLLEMLGQLLSQRQQNPQQPQQQQLPEVVMPTYGGGNSSRLGQQQFQTQQQPQPRSLSGFADYVSNSPLMDFGMGVLNANNGTNSFGQTMAAGYQNFRNNRELQKQKELEAQKFALERGDIDFKRRFTQNEFDTNQAYKNKEFSADQAYKNAMLGIEGRKLDLTSKSLDFKNQFGGGATMIAAKALMDSDPNLSFAEAFSIAKSGLGQGNTVSDGVVTPIKGSLPTKQKDAYAKAFGAKAGENIGQKTVDLPQSLAKVDNFINTLDSLETDKGLSKAIGLKSYAPTIRGSDAMAFEKKLQQAQGQAFLQAFESLKGAGAITEVEGKTAQQAISRLSLDLSEKDFRIALNDLKDILILGRERLAKSVTPQTTESIPTGQTVLPQPQGIDYKSLYNLDR